MSVEIIARVECDTCGAVVKFEPAFGYHDFSGNSGSYNTELKDLAAELENELCEKWALSESDSQCESCFLSEYELGALDEEELSALFDSNILPSIIEAHGEKGKAFTDTDRANEAFNNWTDGLHKDGAITDQQYDELGYTGEAS